VGTTCFFVFGLRNLQITGMIIMMLGLLMNTAPLMFNGATPVSDLALQSVGHVDDAGIVEITGLRESTSTATKLAPFGDVIPVPVVNNVVSLGDLVMLVALADIASNLFLRTRRRDYDDAGVSFAESAHATDVETEPAKRIEILSPLNLGGRPAHAAHRTPRRKAAPSTHVPAHAKEPMEPLEVPKDAVLIDDSTAHAAHAAPAPAVPPSVVPVDETEAVIDLTHDTTAGESNVIIDLTNPADQRPIIDLTVSPTDEQLCEFLRQRELADAQATGRTSPGTRRGRAPRRTAEVAEVHQ